MIPIRLFVRVIFFFISFTSLAMNDSSMELYKLFAYKNENVTATIVENLLKEKADPNAYLGDNEILLIKVCCAPLPNEELKNIIKLLIENKININCQNKSKRTALPFSFFHESTDLVNLLLENKADPSLKDVYERTALHNVFNDIFCNKFDNSNQLIEDIIYHYLNTLTQKEEEAFFNAMVCVKLKFANKLKLPKPIWQEILFWQICSELNNFISQKDIYNKTAFVYVPTELKDICILGQDIECHFKSYIKRKYKK